MDEVNCNGTEEYIWRCPHETEHNCGGLEAMGVICSNDGKLKLIDEAESSTDICNDCATQ